MDLPAIASTGARFDVGSVIDGRYRLRRHMLRSFRRQRPGDAHSGGSYWLVVRWMEWQWLLWGLGWIIVPLLLRQFNAQQLIPIVMFGSLAALFVVTWHKGAIIRAALRAALS